MNSDNNNEGQGLVDSNKPVNPNDIKLSKLKTGYASALQEPESLEGKLTNADPQSLEGKLQNG